VSVKERWVVHRRHNTASRGRGGGVGVAGGEEATGGGDVAGGEETTGGD